MGTRCSPAPLSLSGTFRIDAALMRVNAAALSSSPLIFVEGKAAVVVHGVSAVFFDLERSWALRWVEAHATLKCALDAALTRVNCFLFPTRTARGPARRERLRHGGDVLWIIH